MTLDRVHTLAQEARRTEADSLRLRIRLHAAMRKARETHTLQEIADAAGISNQRVWQLLHRPTQGERTP